MTDIKATGPNKTKLIILLIIPLVTLGVMILIGIHGHAALTGWLVSGGIYVAGDAYEAWQLHNDGDTTPAPYFVMAAAVLSMIISVAL